MSNSAGDVDSDSISDNLYNNEEEELTKGILDSIIDVNEETDINEQHTDVVKEGTETFNNEKDIKYTKVTIGLIEDTTNGIDMNVKRAEELLTKHDAMMKSKRQNNIINPQV
jgi:hypothetical protein